MQPSTPSPTTEAHPPAYTEAMRRAEVEDIFERNSTASSAVLSNLANAMRGVQGDMYWAVDRFVFELLQNADDLPAQPGGSVRVQIRLLPTHLLFQHTGLPFRYEHVLALANVGKSTKTGDATTTGYKGIGFKSVYSESACVYVRSGGYSFRFASNDDMAQSSGLDYQALWWTARSCLREETLRPATTQLVNYQHRQWLAASWGNGTLSSSDGQRFPVSGAVRNARALPKYFGYGRGVTFYTHTADQYAQYGSQVIATTERDATYVLDEILGNETELEILEHTTDTAGYTDLVFALFDLLGLEFTPRLRDIADQKLSKIKDLDVTYPALKFTGQVNPAYLARHWEELVRVAGSLKLGYVTASLFIGKRQAYPRQHQLTYGLQEYGRLVKTIFILRYLLHQPLRRKINTQLNKGEHLHALRSWLWFGGDGVLRRKQEEAQHEVVGCLNLLTNAVVVWNTVYMQQVITQLRAEGYPVQDEDLVHLSPARFEHINRLGKYTFADLQALLANGLRPLRQPEYPFPIATSPA